MGKIFVAGSLNMDLTVYTQRVPAIGETIKGFDFLMSPGGKGANQAIAAARLGAEVSMFGRVGDDVFGRSLIQTQASCGVDTSHIGMMEGISTGIASITVSGGDNFIILAEGANAEVSPEDVDAAAEAIAGADALMVQLEIPLPAVERAVSIAKQSGTLVFFNPAPARPLSAELLNGIDYLIPNETEAAMLLGWPELNETQIGEALLALKALGVKHPLITLGSAGVAYLDGEEAAILPAYRVKAVDTTAAGDTFAGGLAAAIVGGKPLREAIDFAQRAASICVQRKGAIQAIPTLQEVSESLFQGTSRNE